MVWQKNASSPPPPSPLWIFSFREENKASLCDHETFSSHLHKDNLAFPFVYQSIDMLFTLMNGLIIFIRLRLEIRHMQDILYTFTNNRMGSYRFLMKFRWIPNHPLPDVLLCVWLVDRKLFVTGSTGPFLRHHYAPRTNRSRWRVNTVRHGAEWSEPRQGAD